MRDIHPKEEGEYYPMNTQLPVVVLDQAAVVNTGGAAAVPAIIAAAG